MIVVFNYLRTEPDFYVLLTLIVLVICMGLWSLCATQHGAEKTFHMYSECQ